VSNRERKIGPRFRHETATLAALVNFAQASVEDTAAAAEALRLRLGISPVGIGLAPVSLAKMSSMTTEELSDLRLWLQSSFNVFVRHKKAHGGWWTVPDAVLPLTITSVAAVTRTQAYGPMLGCHGEWPADFWLATAGVMAIVADRLNLCQLCGRMYVSTRPGQTFCRERRCLLERQRRRSRKHYSGHRDEIIERKHEAYVSRLPPAVRKRVKRSKRVAGLQRIATEVKTGGQKTPQVPIRKDEKGPPILKRD
jgi:hypothetical protein